MIGLASGIHGSEHAAENADGGDHGHGGGTLGGLKITVVRMKAKGRSQMASTFDPILDCRCRLMPVSQQDGMPKAPPAQQDEG